MPVIVSMYDRYFDPNVIHVAIGQKVIWMNKGKVDHTVVINHSDFHSVPVRPGSSISYTFTKTGVYPYNCSIHSFMGFGMVGKVVVM